MGNPGTAPLVDRPIDSIIAHHQGRALSTGQFLSDVQQLAACLPSGQGGINLVRDRYGFTVGFAAMLCCGQTNILPPNPNVAVQVSLASEVPGAYVLHDGLEVAPGLESVRWSGPGAGDSQGGIPELPLDHLAAVSYTSGSTGRSSSIRKTWNMFRGAADIYAGALIEEGAAMVATVPSQHMYGLELTTLLPLWFGVSLTSGKPLFPGDVLAELERVPGPRTLITTPFHLEALVRSGIDFPSIDRVICATAPLSPALAEEAEQSLDTEVMDVYGCSEAGIMARRYTARTERWQPLVPFEFNVDDEVTTVNSPHMDEPVALQDRLVFDEEGHFTLQGRHSDMVNVAGKRGSLAELTRLMLSAPGVEDGAVFAPDAQDAVHRLAGVYSGTAKPADVRQHMRRYVDAVLLPRPLLQVDQLPRTDTSKLPRTALLALLREHGRS